MGGFGDAIKGLYEKFILRDLLSFIIPGAIVGLSVFSLYLSGSFTQRLETLFKYSTAFHWLLYIPILGGFYLVGFAVQCLGESTGIISFSPPEEYPFCWKQRLNICNIFGKWDKDRNNLWWNKYYIELKELYQVHENLKQERERLIVLKQFCANSALSIFIATTLIIIYHFYIHEWQWLLLFWSVSLLASLFWGYRVHLLRQYAREKVILTQIPKDDKETK